MVKDDAVKFAWAYLLKYGLLTNGNWCYYGSGPEKLYPRLEDNYLDLDKVVKVGVDWVKTKAPETGEGEGFAGTFASYADKIPYTMGTLYLRNGETFKLASTNEDAVHLAGVAQQMLRGMPTDVENLAALL